MPTPPWHIVEYRGRAGLMRLEDDWRRLYAAMPQRVSFHAYEAHLAYVDHLMAHPDRLRCLALSDGERVRGICVLETRTTTQLGLSVPVWAVPRHPHTPLSDVICPEDDARRVLVPTLLRHLRRNPEGRPLLVLGPLRENSNLWQGLRQAARSDCCPIAAGSAHVFDCSWPFGESMPRLSKNFRANLRKARNKLEALPDVRFVTATENADLAAEFTNFLHLEASGWKGEAGTRSAILFRGNQPAFFRALLSLHGNEDHCEINALYAEGRCIASQFCMRTGEECAILKIGYDEDCSRLAPGQLLLSHTLERCCKDPGIRQLNLISDSDWHLDWHPDSVGMREAYVAISRWRGRLLIVLLRLRFGPARRFVHWLRNERERLRREPKS